MPKHRLMNESISNLVSDRDVSDESIYLVYQFLSDLVLEFESQAYGRLRRYSREQERIRNEMIEDQKKTIF